VEKLVKRMRISFTLTQLHLTLNARYEIRRAQTQSFCWWRHCSTPESDMMVYFRARNSSSFGPSLVRLNPARFVTH